MKRNVLHRTRCAPSALPIVTALILLFAWCWAVSCGKKSPEEDTIEIRFTEAVAQPDSVSKIMPLVSPSHQPDQENLSPEHQSLFTYLAKTNPANLVTTAAHSQGEWRIEKVFILDDCVAVQMSEGHYLETLLFVRCPSGWRLLGRIRPKDHQ